MTDLIQKKSTLSAVNTFLILLFGICSTALGWSLKHNIENLEKRLDDAVPRRELDIQISDIKVRLAAVELEIRKIKR